MRDDKLYSLRIWQENPKSPIRANLKNVRTKEEIYFKDLRSFVRYLNNFSILEKESRKKV